MTEKKQQEQAADETPPDEIEKEQAEIKRAARHRPRSQTDTY